jgi:hypothetical protein
MRICLPKVAIKPIFASKLIFAEGYKRLRSRFKKDVEQDLFIVKLVVLSS